MDHVIGQTVYVVSQGKIRKVIISKVTATGFRGECGKFFKAGTTSESAYPWAFLSSHIENGAYASLIFKVSNLEEAAHLARSQKNEFAQYIAMLQKTLNRLNKDGI